MTSTPCAPSGSGRTRRRSSLAARLAGRRDRVRLAAARRPRLRRSRTRADAPLLFALLLPLLLGVVLAEIADGGIDAKAIALLGVLLPASVRRCDRSAPASPASRRCSC